MRKYYRYLFILTFIISSFLFVNNVQAYTASVINPENAKCSLRDRSTGYCYYANKNLDSVVVDVVWLDTGDQVNVLTDHATVDSPNKNICSDYYVYTSFYFDRYSKTYYGYYCHANLSDGKVSDELKEEFKKEGFPESYWSKLSDLKKAHPNWSFKAINTELKFNDVVLNQTYGIRSLIRGSLSNNYAYLSLQNGAFDYKKDRYIPYDAITDPDPWYLVNYDTIAYYVDPRNFLKDMYIFQFETLSYDSSVSNEQLKNSINNIFGNDYLNKFTDNFIEAGKKSLVNPIYLASLSKQEIANGSTPGAAINGAYNKMYNFYNIGAYSGADPVYNGLNFAANTDAGTLRPWNTEYKAIVGGAIWIYNNYVRIGQDTSYFKKFDVVYNYMKATGKTPDHANYSHQYMQNIQAPSSEAVTTYSSYSKSGLLNLSYTFYIPVYNNMPASTSLPNKGGWPNNYLSSIKLNGQKIAGFDGDVVNYNYNLDINNPQIKIEATPVNGTAKISGLGTFNITENTTKTIKVTAQNGDVRNYKIKITLTGTKLEDPVDVKTTLNNAGIKNGDKYITGIALKTDIKTIKEKILNANKEAIVELKNSNNAEKNSGVIFTGDKITITVGSDKKSYEFVIYGDVNGDGKIKATDYVKIKNHIMGTATLSGAYSEAADVDRNGKIKATDYVKIKNYIMGTGTITQ